MKGRRFYKASIVTLLLLQFISLSSTFTLNSNPGKEKLKILGVFLHPGKSHFDVFKPLLEELARRGHDVTVVSNFPRNDNYIKTDPLPNYKDISILSATDVWLDVVDLKRIKHSFVSQIVELFNLRIHGLVHCEAGLKVPEVRKLIDSNSEFDLILTENFNSDCSLGFVHRFQAPFIAIASHQIMPWGNDRMGNPDNPSYIPNLLLGLSNKMNFMERVANTVCMNIAKLIFYTAYEWPTQKIVEEVFGPGVPPVSEIAKKTSAFLHNTHYSVHGARPHVPNVVEIGGIHIGKTKPLPEDIKRFLDDASEGALLFSWGSMVKASTLPEEKLKAVLKVIGSIPRKVIWKWEENDLLQKPKNLMTKKWLPQFDIMSKF